MSVPRVAAHSGALTIARRTPSLLACGPSATADHTREARPARVVAAHARTTREHRTLATCEQRSRNTKTSLLSLHGWQVRATSICTGVLSIAMITTACDSTTIRLRSDYDVSRAPASNSTQAKNEHVVVVS